MWKATQYTLKGRSGVGGGKTKLNWYKVDLKGVRVGEMGGGGGGGVAK